MYLKKITLCCCLFVCAAMAAEPVPRTPQTKAEIDQRLTALAQRQVDLSFTLRDQIRDNDSLWLNPAYTSPEIERLRKRMQVLKSEMDAVQGKLRELVAQVPEARAALGKTEALKAEFQANVRQIEDLRKRREQAP